MDRDKAKFILQSYRPDGADASNPDFTDALRLAAEDRELSLWLAQERAHDAMFAEALLSVHIPDGLRDEILSVMDDDGAGKDLRSEMDAVFIGAMAHVTPPKGLRDQIISAMEIERESRVVMPHSSETEKIVKFPMRWFNVAAIAALLILGVIFSFPGFTANESTVNELGGKAGEKLKLAQVQLGSGKHINASHEVDITDNSIEGVNTWLAGQGMPVANTVPKGLVSCDVRGGCKLTLDNGVQASMIQFKKKDKGEYYLMILDLTSVEDADKLLNLSEVKLQKCKNCPYTKFNIRSWRDEDKAYILLTKSDSKELAELF
jgi:hypothetical protein